MSEGPELQLEVGIIPQDDSTFDITIHNPANERDGIGNARTLGAAFEAAIDDLEAQ